MRIQFISLMAVSMALLPATRAAAVIGGQPSGQGVWGGAVLLTTQPGAICTATVVGPRIVLTSADCIGGGVTASVKVEDDVFELDSCLAHPAARSSPSADVALCTTRAPLFGAAIERIGIEAVAVGAHVSIVGFGCRLPGAVDRGIGQLSAGLAEVTEVSLDGEEAALSGATLCHGDAGGGAYVDAHLGPGVRRLVGVNSRSDLKKTSSIALVTNARLREWARQRAEPYGGICGLSGEAACGFPVVVAATPLPNTDAAGRNAARLLALGAAPSTIASVDGVPVHHVARVAVRAGESIAAVVRRVCGTVDEDYFGQLAKLNLTNQKPLTRDSSIEMDGEIGILPCPKGEHAPKVVSVARGDTLWSYYLDVLREAPTAGWRGFGAPPNAAAWARTDYFQEAFLQLNKGTSLELLEGATVLVPRRPLSRASSAIAAAVGASPGDIRAILSLQGADGVCAGPTDLSSYPYDVAKVLDVMVRNRARRADLRRSAKRVLVLSADSGLFGVGQGVFRRELLMNPVASWDQYAEDVRPLENGPEPMHGTQVASLLLGGPLMARVQSLPDAASVGLLVKRIYVRNMQNGETWYGAEPEIFGKVTRLVHDSNVDVVNLSFKSTTEISALRSEMGSEAASALYVAAAGNNDGEVGATDKSFFPAMWGSALPNLLVVGALDAANRWPTFSNFSPAHVEISAPGCDVPVLSYDTQMRDWRVERQSGTSLSAPLVAFTAALVESEYGEIGMSPFAQKRRLLASADLRADLLGKVADGRTLNVVKAASVFHDVVEVAGSSRLIFGNLTVVDGTQQLQESHTFELSCGGQPRAVRVSELLKMVPRFAKADGSVVTKIYVRNAAGHLRSFECDLPSSLSVLIHDSERDAQEAYPLQDIADIVRKEL